MGSSCDGQFGVWAFILILLLSSLWFIWVIELASYLPVTLALPVTLESGPLPLDYSTCPLRGTGQCRLRALHYYEVYCISTASFSRRYQTFAKLPSSKVNSGWTWTRAIWIFCLSIIQFSKDNCEAQARVRQGWARDGCQGERPQSLNPCLELTLKLVATTHPPPPPPPTTHHHP